MGYQPEYLQSIDQPERFWQEQAQQLAWFKHPRQTLTTDSNGIQRWFADGEMNTSYMALDHHIAQGRGAQTALIYDSPVTGQKQQISYQALGDDVAKMAGVLRSQGVEKGDRVVIYMPMIPEAVVAMLAVARLGAIHSVVFGGFAAHELAVRIDDAQAKIIITASCGIEVNKVLPYLPIVDAALTQCQHPPQRCIVVQRPQCVATLNPLRDLDWHQLMETATAVDPVAVKGSDPLYILYTSGTTGKPKGVVRDNGGHAVALYYSMKTIYGMAPGEVFWAASDIGWVVGHSYIVYAPLLFGCTTVLYEGKPVRTPDAGAFWRLVDEYSVKVLFAAPTAFRAIRKEDPEATLLKQYSLASLRTIFMAGERLDPPTFLWTQDKTQKPVIDHWWQTETGWAICANPIGLQSLPVKPGSATVPVPGFNVKILNDSGQEVPAGQQGNIAIKLPLPPGCLPTVWGDHQRLTSGYLERFPGYYSSGDGGFIDEDGYVFIMGRTDDVINVAGHRLSTGEMEEIVAAHPAVAECAVIGVHDAIKGQVPVGLVITKDGVDIEPQVLQQALVKAVRDAIGAIACLQQVVVVPRLPKTRSGKILRKLLRQLADNHEVAIPSTIDDPASVAEIQSLLAQHGLVKS